MLLGDLMHPKALNSSLQIDFYPNGHPGPSSPCRVPELPFRLLHDSEDGLHELVSGQRLD